jgi:hypothetical protein
MTTKYVYFQSEKDMQVAIDSGRGATVGVYDLSPDVQGITKEDGKYVVEIAWETYDGASVDYFPFGTWEDLRSALIHGGEGESESNHLNMPKMGEEFWSKFCWA